MQKLQGGVQELKPKIKMEKHSSAGPKTSDGLEAGGREPHVVQVGTIREFLAGSAPTQIKQEPEEGLQQRWETQWQEFLKTVESPHSGWRHLKLPEPMSEEETKQFQASLKEIAGASQWSRGEWVTQTVPGLRGAHKPNGGLDPPVKVKEEIVSEVALTSEMRRQRFRHFCYEEAEGPRKVCKQLWELGHQWLRPERRTKDQILEVLILEQFLTILPWEMQCWVRENGPETCAQAVALAEDFLMRLQEPEQWERKVFVERKRHLVSHEHMKLPYTESDPWSIKESELLEGSFITTPSSEQDPSDAVNMQLSTEAKPEGDGEVTYFDGADEAQESDVETFQLGRPEEVTVCEISLDGAKGEFFQETEMAGSPPGPGSHWENDPEKASGFLCEEGDLGLREGIFQDEILKCKIKKEQIEDEGFDLLQSQTVQMTVKPYQCLYCGKTSNCKANLVVHERTHTGEKPYACLDCGKSFNRKSTLVRHKRMHTGEKPYECAECGRCFSIRCNLINHERIHTGEKPYSCTDCGQSFSRRLQLVIHRRTHTGETPYRCAQCGKCFTRRSSLLTHERIHTGEKPNTCTDCGKSFIQKGYLLIHRRIHTGERPYKCTACEQRFLNRSDLRRHEKIHAVANQ